MGVPPKSFSDDGLANFNNRPLEGGYDDSGDYDGALGKLYESGRVKFGDWVYSAGAQQWGQILSKPFSKGEMGAVEVRSLWRSVDTSSLTNRGLLNWTYHKITS